MVKQILFIITITFNVSSGYALTDSSAQFQKKTKVKKSTGVKKIKVPQRIKIKNKAWEDKEEVEMVGEEAKEGIKDEGGVIEISGFFDVNVTDNKTDPNVFSLGDFELDLEHVHNDHFQVAAALVFNEEGAELGAGFIVFSGNSRGYGFSSSFPTGVLHYDSYIRFLCRFFCCAISAGLFPDRFNFIEKTSL